jgi:hypothetical protein
MMRIGWFFVLTTTVAVSTANAAQRRAQGSPLEEKKVAVVIAMKANGAAYNFSGQAVCEHIPVGSIYNVPAERWSARHDDNGRNLNFTLWHPLAGKGDMVTLSISIGGKKYDVNTVKSPQATGDSGSANVKLTPAGGGGTFIIDATTASGAKLNGTIKCESFTMPEPVAGD